jgi:hypothetical protein
MVKNIVFRIIAGLVLLAAIAGIAYFAYQAGVTSGAVANLPVTGEQTVEQFHPFYGMHPFFGLSCLIPLAVLFLFCLAFGSMRRMLWGPRWGWRHMGPGPMGHGPMKHYSPCGEGVPPMFNEWHKRAHAETEKAPEENQK